MELLARVRIVLWEGASLWVVDATKPQALPRRTDYHAHHAIQVTLGLGGVFRLETREAHVDSDAVAVAADAEHVFEAEGLIALLFIEPESRPGRGVQQRLFDGCSLASVPAAWLGDLRARLTAAHRADATAETFIEIGRALVAALSANVVAHAPDLRVRKVIAWAARQIDRPVSLADAVAIGDLSAGRLRHLFVEQTGLPFKTYLLWLRLTRAVEGIAGGASLTQAAHEAGFADSAHLSRTFRRMFGVAPTALQIT